MPRFYDPSRSDPTVLAFNWIDSILTQKIQALTDLQIQQYIKKFQAEKLLDQYKNKEILISNNCSKGNIYLDYDNLQNKYFPAYFDGNKIILCQNMINNSVQLLENLIREFEMSENSNDTQGCKFVRACSKSYKIYKLNFDKNKQLSLICARTLMRHRGINDEQLPMDQWVRHVEKELKQQQCYEI